MATKYIFIDDEDPKIVKGIAGFFESKEESILVAKVKPLISWTEQIMSLKCLLSSSSSFTDFPETVLNQVKTIRKELELSSNSPPDGIILDLRLDIKVDTNYKGNSFAQELRNLSTEESIKDIPLILCSGGNNLNELYKPDTTSHDLFDLKIEKEKLDRKTSKVARKRLKALSSGYKRIHSEIKKSSINLLGNISLEDIDYRVQDYFSTLINRNAPPHEYARFLLTHIINIPGVLISENLLFARLGIDSINSSQKDLKTLLESLEKAKYDGVFSLGWDRWWMIRLVEWWKSNFDSKPYLENLNASERVSLINKVFGINLATAEKTRLASSDYFWYVCKNTGKPISSDDGLLATSDYIRVPWQEDQYYSIDEVLFHSELRVHPIESERLSEIKKTHIKKRSND